MSATISAFSEPRATMRDVVLHVLHGDGQRAVVALHHHAEGVADQEHVDAGLVAKRGEARVVGT